MKTQISRWSDAPQRRRSGVYQQQGRMISDADWNELMELLKRRIDAALGEVVGSGAPRLGTPGLIESGAGGGGAGGAPLIKRGTFYVNGVRASLESSQRGAAAFPLSQQADFPAPPAYGAGQQMLYVDVWEWPTTALEDASLLDPGLQGADTATRTQTLAQVKWCPVSIDPLTAASNPSKGDATWVLAARAGTEAADACDSCATEVALDAQVGNHLFRLEVHDVIGPADAPSEITLKWSAENAAEKCAVAEAPAEFKRGDWIYEFYSTLTERHLGVHLVAGFTPTRAQLFAQGWPAPAALPDVSALPFVRRWDGYATLVRSGTTWTIKGTPGTLQAMDKGRRFEPLPTDAVPTHGHFNYSLPDLTLYLSGLKLGLRLDGSKFVAGDYWQAVIREAAPAAARVTPVSATPLGITHHYMLLGRADGPTVQPASDAEQRRLSFPRLTELTADRVGYSPSVPAHWTDVIDAAGAAAPLNVQRAIDVLIERLESSDLGYLVPTCGTSTAPTVRSLLELASGAGKLDSVLGKLLCELTARQLPLDKSDTSLPPILSAPAVTTVQQGLSVLGNALANLDFEATVGPGGQYATLLDAFTALSAVDHVSLSLLPGVQALPAALQVTNKRSIRLTGSGALASRIDLGAQLHLQAREIVLRDVGVRSHGAGHLVLQADRVVAQNSGFARASTFDSHVWSKSFGNALLETARGIAVDAGNNVILVGAFQGSITFDTVTRNSSGDFDIYVAKFSPAGALLWVKSVGAAGVDRALAVAVDASGNIILTGGFAGTINFGTAADTALSSATLGDSDIFLAKLDGNGNHLWSRRLGSGSASVVISDVGNAVAVDGNGNVLLTGSFAGTVSFGVAGVPDLVSAGGNEVLLAKFSPAGVALWARRFGSTGSDEGTSVAVDPQGNVFLAGNFTGTVSFGGAGLVGSQVLDAFIAKYDSNGVHQWSKSTGSAAQNDQATGLAADRSGNVFLGVCLGKPGPPAQPELFDLQLFKYDAAGSVLWSRRVTAQAVLFGGSARIAGMAADVDGNLVLAGSLAGAVVSFGGSDLSSGLTTVGFVAQLDGTGRHLWSRTLGGGASDGPAMALDAAGNVLLAGSFSGTMDLGGSALTATPAPPGPPFITGTDVFLAKLQPEPSQQPFVTIRPRDPSRGTDLIWSDNDMLVTASDGSGPAQPRTALALATHTIGGSIAGNSIRGRIALQSDSPFDLAENAMPAANVTSVGGGAYLSIRGNDLARVSTRFAATAPHVAAHATLIVADNTLLETSGALLADSLTLSGNQFVLATSIDLAGFCCARQIIATGNQASQSFLTPALRVAAVQLLNAGNSLQVSRTSTPAFQPNPQPTWYFGGVGADLL